MTISLPPTRWLVTMALAVSASALRAQGIPADQKDLPPCERTMVIDQHLRQFPPVGLRFGAPLRASAYRYWYWAAGRNTPCKTSLWVATADLGLGGAEMNWGYMFGRGRPWGHIPLQLNASLLQTFGDPMRAQTNTPYAGAELELQMFWGVRVGAYQRLGGGARGGRDVPRFTAVSVLFGF